MKVSLAFIYMIVLLVSISSCKSKSESDKVSNVKVDISTNKSDTIKTNAEDITSVETVEKKSDSSLSIENNKIKSNNQMKRDTFYTDSSWCDIISGLYNGKEFKWIYCYDYNDSTRSITKISDNNIVVKDSFDRKSNKVLGINSNDTVIKRW